MQVQLVCFILAQALLGLGFCKSKLGFCVSPNCLLRLGLFKSKMCIICCSLEALFGLGLEGFLHSTPPWGVDALKPILGLKQGGAVSHSPHDQVGLGTLASKHEVDPFLGPVVGLEFGREDTEVFVLRDTKMDR